MSTSNTVTKLLEFNHVTVRRGEINALQDMTLSIGLGENVAIIGPNGSGKSTLIKTITRECYPQPRNSAPPVKILGQSMWDVYKLRSYLGIVSSDLQQLCDRKILGIDVALSGFFSSIGTYKHQTITREMSEAAMRALGQLDIEHLADRYMTEMSTGQARRVLIARALVHDPTALLLDEPASSLDPHVARKFLHYLSKIAKNGCSIIMVTHHLHNIIPETDRIIMIKDGKVFADGPKDDMLRKDLLSELFSMQVDIINKNGYNYLLV